MDFIVSLQKSARKVVIFIVVDKLSKYAYFILLGHPFTALEVAHLIWTMCSSFMGGPRVL